MAFRTLIVVALLLVWAGVRAQVANPAPAATEEYTCPMDRDIRSRTPSRCPRCGMKLVPGTAAFVEYPVRVKTKPEAMQAGKPVTLEFSVLDPFTSRLVRDFELVHEKLFHLFLVGEDLRFFAHEHPQRQPDGRFRLTATLPKPQPYRLLADFYPANGTPQLIVKTILPAGAIPGEPPRLEPDLARQTGSNLGVSLTLDPPQPVAGQKTMLFFDLSPVDGLEPYLGAQGHMLAASADLIDLMHAHPAWPDMGSRIQFNLLFPRAGVHKIWVQFQRLGVVNTVSFNVPVKELR